MIDNITSMVHYIAKGKDAIKQSCIMYTHFRVSLPLSLCLFLCACPSVCVSLYIFSCLKASEFHFVSLNVARMLEMTWYQVYDCVVHCINTVYMLADANLMNTYT